jgi:hypothetical protein
MITQAKFYGGAAYIAMTGTTQLEHWYPRVIALDPNAVSLTVELPQESAIPAHKSGMRLILFNINVGGANSVLVRNHDSSRQLGILGVNRAGAVYLAKDSNGDFIWQYEGASEAGWPDHEV